MTLALYGENLPQVTQNIQQQQDGDVCKQFFSTVVDFVKAFYGIVDENARKRAEEKRAMRIKAQMQALQEAKQKTKADKLRIAEVEVVTKAISPEKDMNGPLEVEEEDEDDIMDEEHDDLFDCLLPLARNRTSPVVLMKTASRDESMEYIRHTILGTSPIRFEFDDSSTTRLSMDNTPKNEILSKADNIFERFYSAQEASSEVFVDEYSNKLKKIGSTLMVEYENVYP
mmetsp:Transcript_23462/g.32176  ORF Transcript_23462/g.32176 Transcript_23462/m.32176 type:complete len:228 (+) Transcript_23462:3-686(+)